MDSKLNSELLKAAVDEEEKKEPPKPKRNSKDELVEKICQVATSSGIKLDYSDAKLKRMTKPQLNQVLADVIEQAMRDEMARQVGAKPGASDSIIALGALRMVHDMFAKATEKTINVFLPKYGYEVDGFSDSLKDPTVREATDACLVEIARESDILQYVQSPWARLAIAWGGALVTSVQKVRYRKHRYAPRMEPRPHFPEDSRRQHSVSGGEENGQINRDGRPTVEICRSV